MAQFQAEEPNGVAVQKFEMVLRAAIFKPANEVVGLLLQQAVDRLDAAYQPKPGEYRRARERLWVQGLFGTFALERDY